MVRGMQLGEFSVDHMVDGSGRFRPTRSFAGSTDQQWADHRYLLDEDGRLPFTMGGFLVRGRDRVILVDAGLGPAELMGIQGGAMLDNLERAGVTAGDVTDVVFTHL